MKYRFAQRRPRTYSRLAKQTESWGRIHAWCEDSQSPCQTSPSVSAVFRSHEFGFGGSASLGLIRATHGAAASSRFSSRWI